ncbi:apolipoprotein N-acyltransferase [Limnoglobus roseus]|uniref:Apolipoprotein N-acyltransferase n=1 Tax=Limnoglobus roseus TaxID=2598579 RepID=A0A5C1A6Q3_9BACT|nr:apolipoprotein N-acyltransferase [Limnoglobus roseus]QEL13512.1 apolipoprotein N-acyltransferase [Limnoglobus roseus]
MTQPRVFAPAILSGLLLWLAFYPCNFGFLGYVALGPFLTLVRAEGVSARRRYLAAYAGGLAFFLPALQWIRVAHPAMYAAWIGLALTSAAYFPIGLLLIRRLDRLGKPPLGLTAAVVWVALEYVRAHFPVGFTFLKPLGLHQLIGFAWYYLGHTQHDYPAMIQVADLGGVWLITFMLAVANGTVAEWLIRFPATRQLLKWQPEHAIGFFREMWAAALAVLAFVVVYGYGMFRLTHGEFQKGPIVSAIQADFAQDVKMGEQAKLFAEYDRLCINASKRADLVVWPETCYPYDYTAVKQPLAGPLPEGIREGLKDNAVLEKHAFDRWKTNVLVGTGLDEWDGTTAWRYNSAILLGPDGTFNGRYDKMHLVPFGEYVPLKGTFPWLQNFTPYKGDYSCKPGEKQTRFAFMVGDVQYTFGVLICYEDSEPDLARQFNLPDGDDRPVDFLVNISNDGWFRGSEEHEQHLAVCKFRAVEARRTVVRAVNMGISGFINSDGIIQHLPHDSVKQSLHYVGPATDRILLDPRPSYYAQIGDWPPAVCWGLIAVGLLVAWRCRVRR